MGRFSRDPRPIRQLRAALNAVDLTWSLRDRMPVKDRQQTQHAAQTVIRTHVRAAAELGHAGLAREVLAKARRRRRAVPPTGLRWDEVIDAGLHELSTAPPSGG